MRRLTAGIFSVILGLCTVASADAAVVSKAYLEQQMGLKQDALKTTTAGNITINENDEIGAVTGGIGEGLTNLVTGDTVHTALEAKANAVDVTGVTFNGTEYLDGQIGLKAAAIKLDAQVKANADTIAVLDTAGGGEGVKGLIDDVNANTAAITKLNETAATVGSVANSIKAAVDALDASDVAVTGQFVTSVSETDGVITVTRASLAESDIPTLNISKVNGLQTALDNLKSDLTLTGQENVISITDGVIGIMNNAISESMIQSGAVTESKIGAGAVTENKIGDGAVTANKIGAGAVGQGKIAAKAVMAGNIDDAAVNADALASDAVTEEKIADGNVTANKLADNVNQLINGAIQAPSGTSDDGVLVLTAIPSTDDAGKTTYTYGWETITGR